MEPSPTWQRLLRAFGLPVIPLLAFSAALLAGWPSLPAHPSAAHVLPLAALAIGLVLAVMSDGCVARTLALTLLAVLFATPLNGAWTTGISTGSFLGGLVPTSDAADYMHDAQALLIGERIPPFPARRPLFVGLFSVLLWISGDNLQLALAVLVLGTALATGCLVRAVRATHGPLAAAATALLVLTYYRRFAPTVLTEQLGLPLGLLALAWMWRASVLRSPRQACLGLGLLALALNARAGAFFVLPALLLWFVDAGASTRRARWHRLGAGVLALSLAFAANLGLARLVASPNLPSGNYSYVLYGLAVGGKGWQQVETDHPETKLLPDNERNRRIMTLALAAIRQRPGNFVTGCARSLGDVVSLGNAGFAGFLPGGRAGLGLRALFLGAVLVGLGRCWCKRSEWWGRLLLAAAAGILASVPLVPPADADDMRAYAATFPIVAVLAAIGGGFAVEWVASRLHHPHPQPQAAGDRIAVSDAGGTLLAVLSWGYGALSVVGPVLLFAASTASPCGPDPCIAPAVGACIRPVTGSVVRLVGDHVAVHPAPGQLRLGDFRNGLVFLPTPGLAQALAELGPGTTLFGGVDLSRPERHLLFVLPEGTHLAAGRPTRVCGRLKSTEDSPAYHLMLVDRALPR